MKIQNKKNFKNKPLETTVVLPPSKYLLIWRAAERPFKKRNKEYFSTIAAIVFLLAVILFFLKEWLLIGVIVSLMFVSYTLATVSPEKITYKINTRGILIADKLYKWQQLVSFWFSKKWDSHILNFETTNIFPKRLQLILENNNEAEISKIIEKYLTKEKPKEKAFDKIADWLEKKVPLEVK